MKIFYSYTHKDEDLLDELAKHLAPLKEDFCIEEWEDRKIQAGQDLHKEIDKHLETADLSSCQKVCLHKVYDFSQKLSA